MERLFKWVLKNPMVVGFIIKFIAKSFLALADRKLTEKEVRELVEMFIDFVGSEHINKER